MNTAQQLAVLNNENAREKSPDEQADRTAKIIPFGNFGGMPVPNKFCHCALFSAASTATPRKHFDVEFFPISSGGYFCYEGAELRQDDETVLLHLLWKLAGKAPTTPLDIDPVALCLEMGWTVRAKDANTQRLTECLSRMKRAHLEYFDKFNVKRYETGLVWAIDYNEDGTLTVTLAKHILDAYGGNAAFINRKVWQALPKGLPSWLFAHISSNNCRFGFDLDRLRELSGTAIKSNREFARKVREAMNAITEQTGVEWQVKAGVLYVFKNKNANGQNVGGSE